MKIIEKSISEIRPYENNPRNNEAAVEYVANSIKRFGWKQPIVIDKNGVIVAGHTRWKAAQKLGLDTAPCVLADDLSDEEIKAYRLADNKVAEIAAWNFAALQDELDSIDIDMVDFGFFDSAEHDNYVESFFEENNDPAPEREETYEIRVSCDSQEEADACMDLLEANGYKAKQL